jgi:hypothetical protein
LHAADVVFANLECCFCEPGIERSPEGEGFYAALKAAEALTIAGVHAVGNANNINYEARAMAHTCPSGSKSTRISRSSTGSAASPSKPDTAVARIRIGSASCCT